MRSPRAVAVAASLAVAATLAACSTAPGTETPTAGPSGDAFPVTIQHALGTTVIPEKPERVATVGWGNHEVALALGVVPVAWPSQSWGDDNGDGIYPWVEDKLDELGVTEGTDFVLTNEDDGIPFEEIADSQPDVILAAYSGLTQEEYGTLSQIAPVVAYTTVPWGTTLEEMISLDARALGLSAEGDALYAHIQEVWSAEAAKHPQLAGKKVAFGWDGMDGIGFYTTWDPRATIFTNFGMEIPQSVKDASAGTKEFWGTIPKENADQAGDIEIYVMYLWEGVLDDMKADPLLGSVPALKNDAIVRLAGDGDPLTVAFNPSPLSVEWATPQIVELLAEAADKVK